MRVIVAQFVTAGLILVAFGFGAAVVLAANENGALQSEKAKNKWSTIPEDKKNAGLATAEQHKMFGKFAYDAGGNASGKFVAFHFAQSMGTIHDFTVKDGTESFEFFDAIEPGDYTPGEAPFVTGSVLHMPAENLSIMAHNNPTAITLWRSDANDTTITFTLAENATVATSSAKEVRVNVGRLHGHVLVNGNGTIQNETGELRVMLDAGEHLMFRAHVGLAGNNLHSVNAAFKSDRLGAVVAVSDADGTAIEDEAALDVETETQEIRTGHISLKASSTAHSARLVVVTVGSETLDPARPATIIVKLDGATLPAAANATALQTTTSNGASVTVSAQDGLVEIVVQIQTFSDHTITIDQAGTGTTDGGTSKTTPGFGLVAFVLAALGVFAIRGRARG